MSFQRKKHCLLVGGLKGKPLVISKSTPKKKEPAFVPASFILLQTKFASSQIMGAKLKTKIKDIYSYLQNLIIFVGYYNYSKEKR